MEPRAAASAARIVVDAMDAPGPQVWDDMTVEVAMSVMTGSGSAHLLICDEEGRCMGLITQSQLTFARDSSAYTDRVRLRDVARDCGPFASPVTTVADAEHAMRYRQLGALPVVDEDNYAMGVLTLAH